MDLDEFYEKAMQAWSYSSIHKLFGIGEKTARKNLKLLQENSPDKHVEVCSLWKKKQYEHHKYSCNETVFDNLTEESAYWLGMLASDGCVRNCGQISFSAKGEDKGHIESFKSFINSSCKISLFTSPCSNGKRYSAISFHITSKILVEKLMSYGIVPKKSNLDIDYLKYIPKEFQFAFICGYFDGDGWINKNFNRKTIGILENPTFIFHLKEM